MEYMFYRASAFNGAFVCTWTTRPTSPSIGFEDCLRGLLRLPGRDSEPYRMPRGVRRGNLHQLWRWHLPLRRGNERRPSRLGRRLHLLWRWHVLRSRVRVRRGLQRLPGRGLHCRVHCRVLRRHVLRSRIRVRLAICTSSVCVASAVCCSVPNADFVEISRFEVTSSSRVLLKNLVALTLA